MTANHRPLEEGDIELIDRIRATPCLYDTKDPDFRLVYKKEQQWQNLAEGLVMTHWEARKRWTVLRDRYARELKQLLLHPDTKEYGTSEFFHRMDFLRNFVKKRSVRKRSISNSTHREYMMRKDGDDAAVPIKIFKVDGNVSSFESYDIHERKPSHLVQQKSQQISKNFIIEDSQDSSTTGRYSYIEQDANDAFAHEHDGVTNPMEEHCEEDPEYHDYVEETSAAYEAVEDRETDLHYVSNHSLSTTTVGSSNSNKIPTTTNFSSIGDNKLTQLPQLQQRPSNNTNCTFRPASPSEPNDSEEYFSKTIALYLKQLSRRYKIKAKVEMMQILEKYIELEEMKDNCNIK